MARRGGFPGGGIPGNMNNLMKQAQKMQKQMEEQAKEFTASAGGGAVGVTVTGKRELKAIRISPDAVDPEDVEMLQDMIVAAVNEALRQMEAENQAIMGKLTGGFGGGLPF